MLLLKNKNTVITGCNRGIGKEIVRVFAENGANIWACVRRESGTFSKYINNLEQKHSVSINPVYFDLSDEEQIKTGVKTIKETKEPVDILVNNAGVIFTALFQMTSMQKLKEMFEINYFSQMLLTQYISRIMMRQKSGSIINISSSAALEGNEGRTGYASAKAAMITSTKVLAKELAPYNIRVNAVAPGLTQTEMMESSTPEDALKETLNRICMKRVGQPEEIANSVLFLASDLSSYMTSQVLRVDGGM
ncbi:MAG TPA: SDR family oxidoreductase [Bacteroidales bacterium]|nr:SDR family oxidoreductase [Bacteroidales bacterium]